MGSKRLLRFLEESSPEKFMKKMNRFGKWIIPFNRPHKLRIVELSDTHCIAEIPYRRSNWNHLKGIHAGAIVTIGELAAGTLLIWNFSLSRYRLILSHIETEYHYQGKTLLHSKAEFRPEDKAKVQQELSEGNSATIEMESLLNDTLGNRVATVRSRWQLKAWDAVQTKV
jgi:hypothetical protein